MEAQVLVADVALRVEKVRSKRLGLRVIADHLDPTDTGVSDAAVCGVDHEESASHPFVDIARVDLDGLFAVGRKGLTDGDPLADQGVQEVVLRHTLVLGHLSESWCIFSGHLLFLLAASVVIHRTALGSSVAASNVSPGGSSCLEQNDCSHRTTAYTDRPLASGCADRCPGSDAPNTRSERRRRSPQRARRSAHRD